MKLISKMIMVLVLFVSIPFSQAKQTTNLSSIVSKEQLLGQWRVKQIDFIDLLVDPDNKFTSYSMNKAIVRYDFKQANEFTYVVPNKKKNKPEDGKYWTWSFDQNKQSFTVTQISLQSPPFNFGLQAKIKEVKNYKGYKEIMLEVVFLADNTKALVTLTNLNDKDWDLPPLIGNNHK
ncbi:hypothetical protein [Myroides odoratimimus]|uniref:hypothetical protein n=1 Tax=Myroides odoratimimus TaxID=76832 RepID=UPI001CE2220E|nr:hypothetical protein [Myroides odoratimimus]MCA4807014.1 hypothetical protein [Myroides odoratimimus]